MAKLGSEKRPAIVRVKTEERAHAITAACTARGWQCIAGVEPDELEDISDFERLIDPAAPTKSTNCRTAPVPCYPITECRRPRPQQSAMLKVCPISESRMVKISIRAPSATNAAARC
jgi:hypothetical protein